MRLLTDAQERYLNTIVHSGVRRYNGRARRTLEALEGHGLITVDWDWLPAVKGNGIELRQRHTAQPTQAGIDYVRERQPGANFTSHKVGR